MANYPKEFDDLLQEYLTDGIITAQERKVLLRKAEKLGLDVDEIDLYITAQEQKVEQATDAAVRKRKGQTCPFCGGSVPLLADKCPHCGQHITVEASEELKEIIENLENALYEIKSGRNFTKNKAITERYVRKAKLYYGHNPKIKQLIENVEEESSKATKKFALDQFLKDHPFIFISLGLIIVIILLLVFGNHWIIATIIAIYGGFFIFDSFNDEREREKKISQDK